MSRNDLVAEILSKFKPNATQRKVFQLLSESNGIVVAVKEKL